MAETTVTCLGILVADAIAKTVDEIPGGGQLGLVNQITLHMGGCAANASVVLSKLGVKTGIIGSVGGDGFGQFVVRELENAGVNTAGLKVKPEVNTSASVVLVAGSGERTFLHCTGANAALVKEDVDMALVRGSRILFVTGTNLMPSFDGLPCAEILEKSRAAGVMTVMDTAWDATGRWMEIVEPCLPHLDAFIPSYDEAARISGKERPSEIAEVFMSYGIRLVVIKLGKDGCYIRSADGFEMTLPTYGRIKAVDATGAGDSFAAGCIAGLANGWDLERCGRFANAVGTHCVMKVGATTGIRSMEETLAFMREQDGADA